MGDDGAVHRVPGTQCVVLTHGSTRVAATVARRVDQAVTAVDQVWPKPWGQRVIAVIPGSPAELKGLLGTNADLSSLSALAVSDADDGPRILLNPGVLGRLGPTAAGVVLRHETTHLASWSATGHATPAWLAEGLADYVGYASLPIPPATAAPDLAAAVRAGRLPTTLPADRDFAVPPTGRRTAAGDAARTASAGRPIKPAARQRLAYQEAWRACAAIAARYGRKALIDFYVAIGRSHAPPAAAVASAMRGVLHVTPAQFAATWRSDLEKDFA